MDGIDKLAATIGGRPLLAHTLAAVGAAPGVEHVVVVTGADRVDEFEGAAWLPATVRTVVAGGVRRQDSVRAGFAALEDAVPDPDGDRVVLVHDGARPVVPADLIDRVVAAVVEHGAAIPILPIADTVKRVADGRIVATEDRAALALAQTPQGARRGLLRRALASPLAGDGHGPTRPPCWRPVESRSMSSPAIRPTSR